MFNISLSDKTYLQKAGSKLVKVNLKDILELCYTKLPRNGVKGKHGQVFMYINNVLGKDYWPDNTIFNDYVGECDIDHITKECADTIYNSFEELTKGFPYLLAINYSSSYFLRNNDVGLHVWLNVGELNDKEYFFWMRYIYGMLCMRINKVCGIDLKIGQVKNDQGKYENIIDWHNCMITQRVNLFYSPYKWNENSVVFDDREIKGFDKIKKIVKEKYKDELFFNDSEFKNNEEESESVDLSNIKVIESEYDKVKVDRSLKIGNLSGNDIRWRICSISNELFKNKKEAKKWCDKYFYFENGKSIYTSDKSYGVNQLVLNWLVENQYLNIKDEEYYHSAVGYEVKGYLSEEYKDLIIQKIQERKCLTMRGDTGIGKTVCGASITKEFDAILLVPYLNMREMYEKNGLKIIERENQDSYDGTGPCVMVYDRYSLMRDDQVVGKVVLIDESHVLFSDRIFRKRFIEVVEKIKRCASKIVLISATPLNETNIFNSEEELIFTKKRRYVDLYWKNVKNVDECKILIDKIIDKNLKENTYDRICVFSNRCVRYLYDNLLVKYGRSIHNVVNIYHREYEDLGDIDRLMMNEYLDKKINLGTSLIYNGMNFNNIEKNNLIIIEWDKYEMSSAYIIQCIGRFRKCGINIYVIGVDKNEENYTENSINSEILTKLNLDHKLFSYNEDYVHYKDVVDELYEYRMKECVKEKVLEDLNGYGYIRIQEIEDNLQDNIVCKKNLLKIKIDSIIKKELNEEELSNNENELKKDGMKYYNKEMKFIKDFLWKYNLNKDKLLELNKSMSIESDNNVKYISMYDTIGYLNRIIVSSLDGIEYWENIEKELKNEWNNIQYESIIKKQSSELKKAKELNNKYGSYFVNYEFDNEYKCIKTLIDDLIIENKNKCNKKSNIRRKAREKKVIVSDKMPGSYINKYRLSYGKVFNSSKEMSEYCNVKNSLISIWKKYGFVI